MIFVYLLCFLLLIYYFFIKSNNCWASKGIPYEKPFLFFGSFYNVALRKQHFSERIREIYGKYKTPYVGIHIFNQPSLMVRSPELLKKVLVKDFDKFINRPIASNEDVDPIAFHTLFSARDATWRNLRSKISPVFTSGKMKLMLPLMKECAKELKSHLSERNGQTIEVKNVFKRFTVDIISSCAFGINAGCLKDDNSEIMKMATRLVDLKSFVRNVSIFSFFFLPKLVNIFRLTFTDKTATKYLLDVFDKTIKEREKLNIVRNDLIDLLHNLKKNEVFADKYKFDDVKMAAQAVVFFSAGNDTTSITLTFALYELALNQDMQDRLRQELKENCDDNGDFTYEVLQKMKYLDMVLKETHRKYPLTTFLIREAFDNYTFEETGLTLEKGTSIFVPLAGLHYDPEYYPNPEKYDPERFSDENKAKIVPYTFMPFGEGPRICIGERFAHLVSKLALAHVVKDFAFEVSDSTSVPLQLDESTLFLQNKGGLMLKVVKAD
jgi:cytochrome P450 family 6